MAERKDASNAGERPQLPLRPAVDDAGVCFWRRTIVAIDAFAQCVETLRKTRRSSVNITSPVDSQAEPFKT